MLIGWSPHQSSADLHQPSSYLLDTQVMKTVGSRRVLETRQPVPELLLGRPSIVQSAISALRFEKKYRVATLSFAVSDIDVAAFNAGERPARDPVAGAIDLFLEMAFAGVPEQNRPPVFAGTHTHTGRLEINIVMPRFIRMEAGELRSFNPHPPMKGSQDAWDALGNFLNDAFGWENPRSPDKARAVIGPDWLEKRVAAARRHEVEFTSSAPKLFMLQGAKRIAASRHGRNRSSFLSLMAKVTAAAKYDLEPMPGGAIALVSETDPHPLVLRGTCLGTEAPKAGAPPQLSVDNALSQQWRRRAAWNASHYGKSAWALAEPDWATRVQVPQLDVPSCHPDASRPVQAPHRFATVAQRLTTGLRRLRKHLARTAALGLIGTCLATFNRSALRRITARLETLSYDHSTLRHTDHSASRGFDERPLHSSSAGVGAACRAGGGRPDHGAGLGAERHSHGDGAAQPRARTGRPDAQRSTAWDRTADINGAGAASDLPGYRLDQSAALARRLRAIDMVRALRGAARTAFAQHDIIIGRDHEGGFSVAGAGGRIVFAPSGEITGLGALSQDSYAHFLYAVCDQLQLPSSALQPMVENDNAISLSL
ncbi:hypothetical protein [Sulfitobacter sp. W074]|uniref:hypothetical protein n=1 Tax=Sulfitobacter sp. W074 TaxID=2867026 RepID=UPI0021A6FB2E|nr:hypothetical protein [Sulfitobacter sp. W074]UWR39469.1 hypothetical protein K3762_19140 [Sulfitobacter sp. W074]